MCVFWLCWFYYSLLYNLVLVHPSQYTSPPPIQNWFLLHCICFPVCSCYVDQYKKTAQFCHWITLVQLAASPSIVKLGHVVIVTARERAGSIPVYLFPVHKWRFKHSFIMVISICERPYSLHCLYKNTNLMTCHIYYSEKESHRWSYIVLMQRLRKQ